MSQWQPIETAPKDGRAINVRIIMAYRWQAYSPKSEQWKRGIRGRWQVANDYGGWVNAEYAPAEWNDVEGGDA